MTADERTVLLAAQDKAIAVLNESQAQAEQILSDAKADAVTLLLAQQSEAVARLNEQREALARGELTEMEKSRLLADYKAQADALAETQHEAADQLKAARHQEAVDCLMLSQRTAAAVLLEAWMWVTEGRSSL